MRVKVGTALDPELLRRARAIALREGKRLNQVIEEALSEHLTRKTSANVARVTARTAGCLRMAKSKVDRILRDEPGILDQ